MKTYVYIDAFNLYFGCLKRTPYKWLDLSHLCACLLPKHDIACIKYFTALVKARHNNPDAPKRQQNYLRALRTIPDMEASTHVDLGKLLHIQHEGIKVSA